MEGEKQHRLALFPGRCLSDTELSKRRDSWYLLTACGEHEGTSRPKRQGRQLARPAFMSHEPSFGHGDGDLSSTEQSRAGGGKEEREVQGKNGWEEEYH